MNNLKTYQIFILFLLLSITLIIFVPMINASYAYIDDFVMLQSNSGALKSISLSYVIDTFKNCHEGLYHPLVTLSYSAEVTIFGFFPAMFHFDNILLHLVNILLVFLIFFKLSNSFWLSLIITSLFAIHPTRAEVVCWISARKDLLCTFFYLLSVLFYVKTYDNVKIKRYICLSVIMFLLACFSKAMAITIPFVLILIDLYKNTFTKQRIKIYLVYFFLSFIFVLVALNSHYEIEHSRFHFDIFRQTVNFINAHFNILFYLDKLLLPINLYCMYPFFYDDFAEMPPYYILYSPAILYILVYLSYLSLKKTKVFFYGFIFFILTILPSSNILPIGDFAVADRYTYIPYLGLFFIFAKLIIYFYNKYNKLAKTLIIVFLIAIFMVLNYLTYNRVLDWQTNNYSAPKSMIFYEFGIKKVSKAGNNKDLIEQNNNFVKHLGVYKKNKH